MLYDLRGPVHQRPSELEAQGRQLLRLNIGNPALFGFEAPQVIIDALRDLPQAREAIGDHCRRREDFPAVPIEDIVVGNGVSELVGLTLQGLLEPGDEVLIPSPDYLL